MKKPLVENLFGKIMGRLLKGQAKKVVKLLQADPELARLAKETGEASEKLKKALKKAEKSNKEKMKKLGI
tara:strand:- start:432 stop:641 length:210 start_codon:yes stop_codon:yes gene_type:complete